MYGHGPYVFKLHGMVYHQIGTLLPRSWEDPRFAQVYLYDHRAALNASIGHQANASLDEALLGRLRQLILQRNPCPASFKHMMEHVQAQETRAAASDAPVPEVLFLNLVGGSCIVRVLSKGKGAAHPFRGSTV